MTTVPKGYVAFTLDARALVAYPAKPIHRAGSKLPDGCVVGPVTDTDNYWTVAESFDEVCAKLSAALGEHDAQKPVALDPLIERAHLFATFCACESGEVKARAQSWLADYDAAVRAYKESAK